MKGQKANHNYKQRNEYSVHHQKQLEKKRIAKLKAKIVDGDIFADDFLEKPWFIELQQKIFAEIKRLKVCSIGDLVRGRFADTDRYHFATALQSLEVKLVKHHGLITRYSVK
jgi:hypothetical protein